MPGTWRERTPEGVRRRQLREWALKAYANAVDPDIPDYLGWESGSQTLVDAAYLCESFLRAYDALWMPLDSLTKARYIKELQGLHRYAPPYSNWLIFVALEEAFLLKVGATYDEYRIHVGEWPEPGCLDSLQIDESWDNDGMEVAFATRKGNLTGRFSCRLSENGAEILYDASQDGKQVYYNREKIPGEPFLQAVPENLRRLLPADIPFSAAYRLPLGIIYVVSGETKQYQDIQKTDYCSALLFPEAEYAELRAWTLVENRTTKVVLRKNSVCMRRAMLEDGRIQTYFEPEIAGASGIYKTELAGRYFLSE